MKLCGQVENYKWILWSGKKGIKLEYLGILTTKNILKLWIQCKERNVEAETIEIYISQFAINIRFWSIPNAKKETLEKVQFALSKLIFIWPRIYRFVDSSL